MEGPGYLRRLIAKKELNDFWELRQYLRKETQGYVLNLLYDI